MAKYEDPVLVAIRDMLNEHGPKELKNHYGLGDPLVVNQSELPMAFISFDVQDIGDVTNAEIQSDMRIVINVVYDLKRDFGQGMSNVESHMSVVNFLTGRNPDFTLKTDSILGALMAHEDLAEKLWINLDTVSEVDYGVGLEKRGPGIYTAEGVVRFTVKNHQLRPDLVES
jgi:hypothetical protein